MQSWLNSFFQILSTHHILIYPLMGVISFLESFALIGLIFPGVLIIGTAGFLSSHNIIDFKLLVFCCTIGAIAGDISSYFVAYKYGTKIMKMKILKKYQYHYEKGKKFFDKYGGISVFLGRFIGFLRPVIPFLAGIHKMDRKKFYLYVVLSGILWGICYPGLGYIFGESWQKVESSVGKFFIIISLCLAFILYKFSKRINKH